MGTRSASPPQAARTCYLVINVCLILSMSLVIVDSYSLCTAIGLSEASSGQVVGEYSLGFCFGAASIWFLSLHVQHLWRRLSSQVLVAGIALLGLGALTYAWVASKASHLTSWQGQGADVTEAQLAQYGQILLLGRIVSGVGAGMAAQCYVSAMLHITPVEDRPEHSTRWILSTMLSFGFGPSIAAAVELFMTPYETDFRFVGYVQLILVACALCTVLVFYPSLEGVEDCAAGTVPEADEPCLCAAEASTVEPPELGVLARKRRVVVGCIVMTMLRACITTSAEVVIVMLLEKKYGFTHSMIGIAIGAIFLTLVPLKMFHDRLGQDVSATSWIRFLSGVALVGSVALASRPRALMTAGLGKPGDVAQFILASLVVLPSLSLGDALSIGMMHQHILPEGSLLDANYTNLWYNLCVGMARFLGPWCGRAVLAVSYDAWVAQHVAVIVLFIGVFEAVVVPALVPAKPVTTAAPARG